MTKITKATTKKTVTTRAKVKIPIKISKTYVPKDSEKYMCEKHQFFFKLKLQE